MVFLEQLLGKIDAELKQHKGECDEMAQLHLDWLAETVQTNKRKLKYQTYVLSERSAVQLVGQPQGRGNSW